MNKKSKSALLPVQSALREKANAQDAQIQQRFFKTGPGEYGEGDIFIGVRVPVIRKIAKAHRDIDKKCVVILLTSAIHEERLLALLILVSVFDRADDKQRADIYQCYLKYINYVNNWDLVDSSAPQIVGQYLLNKQKQPLYKFAKSSNVWQRRIAIMATLAFIKQGKFNDTLKLAKQLLNDEHDLIHKAVGWMLREIGKRDITVEETFLKKYYLKMPRTMLRYAIEHFEETKRQCYLTSSI